MAEYSEEDVVTCATGVTVKEGDSVTVMLVDGVPTVVASSSSEQSMSGVVNHVWSDSSGLHVADNSDGNNILIDSDSVDIRDGSTTVASFTSNSVSLAKNGFVISRSGNHSTIYSAGYPDTQEGTNTLSVVPQMDIGVDGNTQLIMLTPTDVNIMSSPDDTCLTIDGSGVSVKENAAGDTLFKFYYDGEQTAGITSDVSGKVLLQLPDMDSAGNTAAYLNLNNLGMYYGASIGCPGASVGAFVNDVDSVASGAVVKLNGTVLASGKIYANKTPLGAFAKLYLNGGTYTLTKNYAAPLASSNGTYGMIGSTGWSNYFTYHSNGGITVTNAGIYRFDYAIAIQSGLTAGDLIQACLYTAPTGSAAFATVQTRAQGASGEMLIGSNVLELSAGETRYLTARNYTAARGVTYNDGRTHIIVTKVG